MRVTCRCVIGRGIVGTMVAVAGAAPAEAQAASSPAQPGPVGELFASLTKLFGQAAPLLIAGVVIAAAFRYYLNYTRTRTRTGANPTMSDELRTRVMNSPDAFRDAENEYFRLKGKRDAGRISPEQFNVALKNLLVQHGGRYWAIGAETGKWYVHDGHAWVEADLFGAAAPALDERRTPAVGVATGVAQSAGGRGQTKGESRPPIQPQVQRENAAIPFGKIAWAQHGLRVAYTVALLFATAWVVARVLNNIFAEFLFFWGPGAVYLARFLSVGILAWTVLAKAEWPRSVYMVAVWLTFLTLLLRVRGF